MKPVIAASLAALACALAAPLAASAQTAPMAAPASAAITEDARLTAFLDAEFAAWVRLQPQLATRLGMKEGGDKWNDISDAAADAEVAWRQDSVARMRAQFDRARLSPEAQVNFDIWALEADRAALANKDRMFRPPLYSRLYSVHSQLPDFLVNTHTVADVTDLKNYIARLRGIPAVLDVAIA
ncbi:MAG: DUF885 family protein, partial [Novosphingobium meiothermophilum]